MYDVYVTKVTNIRPAENADRLNLCDVFGNTTVVDKSVNEDTLYLYFPVDGQISKEFGEANDLFRRKDENGKYCGGFIEPTNRKIRALKLRGNRSDGLVLPLTALAQFGDISKLKEGDKVTVFNGHEIARKYIPPVQQVEYNKMHYGSKIPCITVPIAPLFTKHADTEQLGYNLDRFKASDEIEISVKLHGTSQRTGYLPKFKGYKKTLWDKIFRRKGKPIYEYAYVSGTRRTILKDWDGGFYGSNEFRQQHAERLEGKLHKGETVYYEVVGFTTTGQPIMGTGNNEKLGKDFVKIYGPTTTFSYGCEPHPEDWIPHDHCELELKKPQSDMYVYRMTLTNEDGFTVEYSPDFMRYRCEQIGVKCVPQVFHGFIPQDEWVEECYDCNGDFGSWLCRRKETPGEWVKNKTEEFYDGPDPIDPTHIREGVVVRIVNRPKFTAFKYKNFSFKLLSGIISETLEQSGATAEMSADELSEL